MLLAIRATAVVEPATLLAEADIKTALDSIKRHEPELLEEQVRLCEIPAPAFKEQARAKELERWFKKLGLHDVRIDAAGNVIGVRPGAKPTPNVVIAAHLDTVFPEETNLKVTRSGAVLKAPGIGDDTRGLVALISVIRGLNDGRVKTNGTITFVADVGEEGLGDLRGTKALFNDSLKGRIDYFISIDGTGSARIVNTAVGSYRYRVTFKGPGGHSYGAFGLANPISALGRAAAKIGDTPVPKDPKTTFNIGRIGGGTSVNSIPFEAWMEVDMRSHDTKALETVRDKILADVKLAAKEENDRWGKGEQIVVDIESVGIRPAGNTPAGSPIVKTMEGAVRALGLDPRLATGSTDANFPMSLGVPAITIGGGGEGVGAHSLNETFDTTDSHLGPQAALLLVVALAR
ncbi:MAG TPA: M20/M25/M40 family metallo-hydrolase [Candidatus Didemnitutus sp.]|nr:M20/M25/M40 family metallo-hydrolase [Candidatus Didemnitutus sp.]